MIKSHLEQVSKQEEVIDSLYCNSCGKEIKSTHMSWTNDFLAYDHLHVQKIWGYFGKYDGQVHKFDLCEDCYEQWIQKFRLPVEIING